MSRIIHHTENHHTENHSTQTTLFLIMLVTMAATLVVGPPAHSQTTTVPLGTLTPGGNVNCPPGFYTGMTCFGATVACPSTDNISLTIGYVGPTVLPTPKGTIVFFGGGSGTMPAEPGPYILSFDADYVQDYTIVNVAWASAWAKAHASGNENMLLAALQAGDAAVLDQRERYSSFERRHVRPGQKRGLSGHRVLHVLVRSGQLLKKRGAACRSGAQQNG